MTQWEKALVLIPGITYIIYMHMLYVLEDIYIYVKCLSVYMYVCLSVGVPGQQSLKNSLQCPFP